MSNRNTPFARGEGSPVNNPLPLTPREQEELSRAGLVFAVDTATGRESLVYGRHLMERVVKDGVAREVVEVRVPVDLATEHLEALLAWCVVLKGGHCYRSSTERPVEHAPLADGSVEVWTTDADPHLAEERADDDARFAEAVADYRRRGHARPVLLLLHPDCPRRERLRASLPATAREVRLSRGEVSCWLVTIQEAREWLKPLCGKQARGFFRKADWPVGYFTVEICADGIVVFESRTEKDSRGAA
jgi:hypothetical protein